MKHATEFAKKFKSFRRKLPSADEVIAIEGVIEVVVYSHLLWNATHKQAIVAYDKLIASSVDLNELRINHVAETIQLIGNGYPQVQERAKRLRAVLNAIYKREHDVSVGSLEGIGKREIREYFETLNGMTPFVCNRVIALCFGVAAIPVDDRTLSGLINQGVVHEETTLTDAASWLVRQVKAAEVLEVHARLHAWVATQPVLQPKQVKKKIVKRVATKEVEIKKSPKKKAAAPKTTTKKKIAKKVAKKTPVKKKVAKKKVVKKQPAKKKVAKKKVTKKKTKK